MKNTFSPCPLGSSFTVEKAIESASSAVLSVITTTCTALLEILSTVPKVFPGKRAILSPISIAPFQQTPFPTLSLPAIALP